ncbi:MAG: methyltransferase C-terminal domain-containing protein [Gemmatimonadota bacterium]|nr:methyltransferase C-terminal domain-containing protein [Gemmatimonadota bacterium]
MSTFRTVESCRICGNAELVPTLDLGEQTLTGVFPRYRDQQVTRGPLQLVRCHGGDDACGLVQLRHSYDSTELYGSDYGYRSSLNRSMVGHLRGKVDALSSIVPLDDDDMVLDIGSNDGTTLSSYPEWLTRVGRDPTIARFGRFYPPGTHAIPEFFSADVFRQHFGSRKAKIITSIAMFYDLDTPLNFVEQVADILDDSGIWHFEQSYMPAMLAQTAYDTICHEHLEYYALRQIEWMLDKCGLVIIDVELNDVNGGSFGVTAAKPDSGLRPREDAIERVRASEAKGRLDTSAPFERFAERVSRHREQLGTMLDRLCSEGSTVLGYGASTKGNVLLQYCDIGPDRLPYIAEVNEDKYGCFTPGSGIPIISEAEAHAMNPDYLLVLPWHFRANLVERERAFLERGGRMIFPLPAIETVDARQE